jgi:hypothetical protein
MAFISAITDAGIARATSAYAGSVTFNLTTARFSSDILTPTTAALQANTGLINLTYTAPTSAVGYHIIDSNTIMLRVNLPPGLAGFSFGSYSLNLDDGTPLVVGTWDTLQIKDTASARYIEETINFSNAVAVINLTILNTIDAPLPEVANELGLPPPLSAPYPVYFVHAHTPYNNRPAIAMRLGSNWYFIDSSLMTNATGTTVTSDDRWAIMHRFFGGSVRIGPDPGNTNQQTVHFIDSSGNSLARFYRAADGTLRITDNATAINTITINSSGDLTTTRDISSGRDVTAVRNITATGNLSAGGAISAAGDLTVASGIFNSGVTIQGDDGQWSSQNYSRSLLITSGRNPAIGLADHTGANLWAIGNSSGILHFYPMPAYTNTTTPPSNGVSIDRLGNIIAAGNLNTIGGIVNSTGDITASGGRLRASLGVSLADGASVPILVDFGFAAGVAPFPAGNYWFSLPGGVIVQIGSFSAVADSTPHTALLSRYWPGGPVAIVVGYMAHNNPPSGSVGADFSGASNGNFTYQNTYAGGGTHGCYFIAVGN